jgi:predicted GNAT superfamily acetyltransferase
MMDAPVTAAPTHTASVAIRPLATLAELRACVALQEAVWGTGFSEAVSVSLLKVATQLGGLALGAFGPDRALTGFVFGLTGPCDGRIVHWSHLLGVLGSARNHGVGRMLKEHQRVHLARQGIDEMLWSFDPLVARNAHLNLTLLGARVVRYAPDMYGPTISPLHHGLATDRLVVACRTAPAAAGPTAREAVDAAGWPVLSLEPRDGDHVVDMGGAPPARIRLEIPSEFHLLRERSPAWAAEWHAAVREHFLWSLQAGYTVAGFHRDSIDSRAFYLLTTTPSAEAPRERAA